MCTNSFNTYTLNPAVLILEIRAMLVSASLCAQHYAHLQMLFHLLQKSRWSDIISVFELKKLSLERLNDLNKIPQLIRGKAQFSL